LQILELGPVVASYLFSTSAQIRFEPSLESALGSLGFLIYPAKKEHPSEAGKIINKY
jgi:hypothetical protein